MLDLLARVIQVGAKAVQLLLWDEHLHEVAATIAQLQARLSVRLHAHHWAPFRKARASRILPRPPAPVQARRGGKLELVLPRGGGSHYPRALMMPGGMETAS